VPPDKAEIQNGRSWRCSRLPFGLFLVELTIK
jgi:hypothetical protein